MQVSILSERRVHRPYGLHGGEPAQCGKNIWVKLPRARDFDLIEGEENPPRRINIGGRQSVRMGPGDRIEMSVPIPLPPMGPAADKGALSTRHTPGGGGYGVKGGERKANGDHVPQWESRGSLADRHSAAHAA
jgi:5-oxoprolinase (ATP-hydrolysing)